jgi:hypothetical protein
MFAVIFAAGGWWTARTWRQLWRAGRSPWERLGWATDSAGLFGPMMTAGLLAALLFGTPVALHLGYF